MSGVCECWLLVVSVKSLIILSRGEYVLFYMRLGLKGNYQKEKNWERHWGVPLFARVEKQVK